MACKTAPAWSAKALAPEFAWAMRDMHVRYTGPTANLRYGNELAQRCVDEIRARCAPENHARLFMAYARRFSEAHWKAATRVMRSPLGAFVDRDYAAKLKQAAFAMHLMAIDPRHSGTGKEKP